MRKIKVNAIKAKNLTSGEETPIPSVSPKGMVLEQNDEVQKVQVLEPSDIANMATKSDLTTTFGKFKVLANSGRNGYGTNETTHTTALPNVYTTYLVGVCADNNINLFIGCPRATTGTFDLKPIIQSSTSMTCKFNNGNIVTTNEPTIYHQYFVLELV